MIARVLRCAGTAVFVAAALVACAGDDADSQAVEPFASTYQPLPADDVLYTNATLLTGTGERYDGASILLRDGKIRAIGPSIRPPSGVPTVDVGGRWITPGIIDVHSHLGVYASPGVHAHSDGNEMTAPVTAEVWAEHSVWPQDPGFSAALAGGVTTLQILPGSANLIGGRTVTVKNVPGSDVQSMKFPGAPHGLKMACGENPKRVYGAGRNTAPGTRMGNVAGYRDAWIRAADYRRRRDSDDAPVRDLELETLAGVLDGDILVHIHCYRADEMSIMLDVAKEFGYRVTAFHHAVESYKITAQLAEHDVCSAMWADWWGFKMEAFDGIRENVAFVDAGGACAIVHSDSALGIQRLNQEAAKAMAAGKRAGLELSEADAIAWITSNAAKALGISEQTGALAVGKDADIVVWSDNPFSVYARADLVYIDGARVYDRSDPTRQPLTDFSLGTRAGSGEAP
ncbi:MAG: amidohydrolase [Pseudomonadota bacterium]